MADLVWHCGKWAEYSGANLEAMSAGTYVDEDHDDAYWDAMNAQIAAASKSMAWEDILSGVAAMRERARAALEALPGLTDEAAGDFSGETFVRSRLGFQVVDVPTIDVYNLVKDRIEPSGGETLALSANFRSLGAIADWVNPLFDPGRGGVFPAAADAYQAGFMPLETVLGRGRGPSSSNDTMPP